MVYNYSISCMFIGIKFPASQLVIKGENINASQTYAKF